MQLFIGQFGIAIQVLISLQRVVLFKIVPLFPRVIRFNCCLEDSDLLYDVDNIRFFEDLLEPMCFQLVGSTRLAATEAILRSKSVEIEYQRL